MKVVKISDCGFSQYSHESFVARSDLLHKNVIFRIDVRFNAAVRSLNIHDRTTQQADSVLQSALDVQLGDGFAAMAVTGFQHARELLPITLKLEKEKKRSRVNDLAWETAQVMSCGMASSDRRQQSNLSILHWLFGISTRPGQLFSLAHVFLFVYFAFFPSSASPNTFAKRADAKMQFSKQLEAHVCVLILWYHHRHEWRKLMTLKLQFLAKHRKHKQHVSRQSTIMEPEVSSSVLQIEFFQLLWLVLRDWWENCAIFRVGTVRSEIILLGASFEYSDLQAHASRSKKAVNHNN